MRNHLVVAAAVAALAGQGCTVIGIAVGAKKASSENDEREARIQAGTPAEDPEDDEEASVELGVIAGGLVGALIDGVLMAFVVVPILQWDPIGGENN